MASIFVNLPVKDLPAAKAFYEAIGFTVNPKFTNDDAAALVLSEAISVMLLTEPFFSGFIPEGGKIADPATTEVINALSYGSRAEADAVRAKAIAAGGRPWKDPYDYGFMYGVSFTDPDGHVWEAFYMDESQMPEGGA